MLIGGCLVDIYACWLLFAGLWEAVWETVWESGGVTSVMMTMLIKMMGSMEIL